MPVGDLVPNLIGDLIDTRLGWPSAGGGVPSMSESLGVTEDSRTALFEVIDSRCTFSGGDVTAMDSEDGTHTMDFSAGPPEYIASGPDGHEALEFDGTSEYGVLTSPPWGPWGAGSRPALYFIGRKTANTTTVATSIAIYPGYLYINETISDGVRDRAGLSDGTGDLHYSYDSDLHLKGARCHATGFTVERDGVESTDVETGGLSTNGGDLTLSATRGNFFGANIACEFFIAEAESIDIVTYRNDRVAVLYPTIGAALP